MGASQIETLRKRVRLCGHTHGRSVVLEAPGIRAPDETFTDDSGEERGLWWHQVLRAGMVEDRGMEITPRDIELAARSYQSHLERYPEQWVDVDAHHANAWGTGSIEDRRAMGWVHRLEARSGASELWALIDWNDDAREMLAARQYRYLSSEIVFVRDEQTDEVVDVLFEGVSITNNPAVLGMRPLFSATRTTEQIMPTTLFTRLGLAKDAAEEQAVEALDQLQQEHQELAAQVETLQAERDEAVAKADQLAEQAPGEGQVVLSAEKLAELTRQAKRGSEAAEALQSMKVSAALDRWILSEHRLLPAQREQYETLCGKLAIDEVESLLPPKGTHSHLYESGAISGDNPQGGEGEGTLDRDAADQEVSKLLMKGLTLNQIAEKHPHLMTAIERQ